MQVATAEQIQREVLTTQEAVINEADKLIKEADDNIKHMANLEEMGFTGAKTTLEEKMKKAKDLAYLVDLNAIEYPGLKFIPYQVMQDVCKKYGLAIGTVDRYTGEVPAWALAQIKANKRHIGTMKVRNHVKRARAIQEWVMAHAGERRFVSYQHAEYFAEMELGHDFGMEEVSNLMIAAPVHQMKVERHERVKDGKIEVDPEKLRLVMDPIVCLYVVGGYIVLAAWGEEGQDPRVFNANNN